MRLAIERNSVEVYGGHTYAVLVEDGFIYRHDNYLTCRTADGRSWNHPHGHRQHYDAEQMRMKVEARGIIDTDHWVEFDPSARPEPYTVEQEMADEEFSLGLPPGHPGVYRVERFADGD